MLKKHDTNKSIFKLIYIFFITFSISFATQSIDYPSITHFDVEKHYSERSQAHLSKTTNPVSINPFQERTSLDPGLDHVVFGFLPWWMLDVVKTTIDYDLLTHIAIFDFACNYYGDYKVNTQGDTIGYPPGFPEDWEDILNDAHANGVKLLMSISAYNFDKDIMHNILHDSTAGNNLLKNTAKVLKRYNLDGVIFNFEHPYDEDKGDIMTQYIQKANNYFKEKLGPEQTVTFAAPPINWGSLWDLPGLINACDFIVVMGYDFSWAGSETTGPCAPIFGSNYNILKSLDNTETGYGYADQSKIVLVFPYYGFSWEVSESEKNIPGATTLKLGDHIVYSQIRPFYNKYGIYWDPYSEEPWTFYQKNGKWYQSWCDNVTSLANKQKVVQDYGLMGTGMWALGYDENYSELWDLLKENYYVFSTSLEMDNFEAGKGRFYHYPTFSGSTQGISSDSHTEISQDEAFQGNSSIKIVLLDDESSDLNWETRLLSATGKPSKNAPIPKGHYFKFSMKTNSSDVEVGILLDDRGEELEISPRIPIKNDNRWHEYSIKIDSTIEWDSYENGNAWIDSSYLTLDALLICAPNDNHGRTIYLDAIKAEENDEPSIPNSSVHQLNGNFPNPFNASTTINYDIKSNSHVTIKAYDLNGREIEKLVDTQLSPNQYNFDWSAFQYPSGIYFIILNVDGKIADVEKITLLK